MKEIIRHSDKCVVQCISNRKEVDAIVMDFKERTFLNVVINKSVKLSMVWNGRKYEGRAAGMDFESQGPNITKSQTALRG
jgi:hypothetical protein